MKMKEKSDKHGKERICKKCGEPLSSISKYDLCENCRRVQAENRQKTVTTIVTVVLGIVAIVPGIKHIIKK